MANRLYRSEVPKMTDQSDSDSDYDLNWDGVSPEMAQQILHQGEIYLSAQLQTAIASDQRSTTSASVFVGFAAAILAASLAYWSNAEQVAVVTGGIATSVFLLCGACCHFHAARPSDFYFPGNHPEAWFGTRRRDLAVAIGGEAENYQFCIAQNEGVLSSNAEWYRRGSRFVLVAPIFGLLIFSLFSYLASDVKV